MTAELKGNVVVDEYGDEWEYFADDGRCTAVQRDAGETFQAGVYSRGTLTVYDDGRTFGVNCADEFIVRGGQWETNE